MSLAPPRIAPTNSLLPRLILHPGVRSLGDQFVAVAVDVGDSGGAVLCRIAEIDRDLVVDIFRRSRRDKNIGGGVFELRFWRPLLGLPERIAGPVAPALGGVGAPFSIAAELLRLVGAFVAFSAFSAFSFLAGFRFLALALSSAGASSAPGLGFASAALKAKAIASPMAATATRRRERVRESLSIGSDFTGDGGREQELQRILATRPARA